MYFLFVPGLPRSYSTSLYTIIKENNSYGTLSEKECPYLFQIFTELEQKSLRSHIDLKEFPNKSKEKNLENYFLGLESIKKSHHIGVSDFCTRNLHIKKENLEIIKNYLPYKFRTVLLFRDPVKHLYSMYCREQLWNSFEYNSMLNYKKISLNIDTEIDFYAIEKIKKTYNYVDKYDKFKNVFGDDMLHFVSEELFTSKSQQNLLEDFLSIPKNSLDFNVHVNQSNSKLSVEKYNSIFTEVKPVYDQWESKFGSLPSCWGNL